MIIFSNLIQISLKFAHKGSIKDLANIGSDSGLVPNRWQAIILTNLDLIYIYASFGLHELNILTMFYLR